MEPTSDRPPGPAERRPVPGSRPRSYKTECIVLRSRDTREADRLVTVLAPSMGKLTVTVRGARRAASKLGGHLDVLNRTNLTLALGHSIDVVTGAESLETFGAIKADLDRLALALYFMELADALLPQEAPHPAAYALLLGALRALNGETPATAVARYLELRLLEDSGYLPELRRCLVCGKEVEPEHHRFAPAMGGVVCDTCIVPLGQVLPLSLQALKVLRHYAGHEVEDALRVQLDDPLAYELELLLGAALQQVLEREMATTDFVEHLRRLRRTGS
jgi:DNA repair protein RecO (recombination protein O)